MLKFLIFLLKKFPPRTCKSDDDWTEIFHPVHGNCLSFTPNTDVLEAISSEEGGVDSIALHLNLSIKPKKDCRPGMVIDQNDFDYDAAAMKDYKEVLRVPVDKYILERSRNLTSRQLSVFVYQEGSFLSAR